MKKDEILCWVAAAIALVSCVISIFSGYYTEKYARRAEVFAEKAQQERQIISEVLSASKEWPETVATLEYGEIKLVPAEQFKLQQRQAQKQIMETPRKCLCYDLLAGALAWSQVAW